MNSSYVIMSVVFALVVTIPVTGFLITFRPFQKRIGIAKPSMCVFVGVFVLLMSLRVYQMCESADSKFEDMVSPTIPDGLTDLQGHWNLEGMDPSYVFHFSCSEEAYNALIALRHFESSDTELKRGFLNGAIPPEWRNIFAESPTCRRCMEGTIHHYAIYSPKTRECVYLVVTT